MPVPASVLATAAATMVVLSGLTACSSSGEQTSPAAESPAPMSSGIQVPTTPAVTSTVRTIPWRVTGISPHWRAIDITFRGSICSSQHVSVRQTKSPGTPTATWVTTITVQQQDDQSVDCVTGSLSPVTKTIHAAHPMLGCFAKLVDASTGKPPHFKRSLRSHLVWNCPAEIVP